MEEAMARALTDETLRVAAERFAGSFGWSASARSALAAFKKALESSHAL
jgi:hypothetical protein